MTHQSIKSLENVIELMNRYISSDEYERVTIEKDIQSFGISQEDFESIGPFQIRDACIRAINQNLKLEIEDLLKLS